MHVAATAQTEIRRPVAEVFDRLVATRSLPELCLPYGPLAGIVDARIEGDATLAAGVRRVVTMSDGAVLVEDVLELERPQTHAYRWTGGLRLPASLLVRSGEGRWAFSESDGVTTVQWRYRLELTSPLAYPVALLLVRLFDRWMQRALDRGRAALEGA
ncbi:MAG: SRPBCC family protein [Nannocystaceae bacterium]